MRLLSWILLASVALGQSPIRFADFSNTTGLTLNNHAAVANGDVLRLTPSSLSQRGSAFLQTPVDVVGGFDMAFSFRITSLVGGGADGFAFVLHADPRLDTAFGNHASALGYGAFLNAPAGTAIANSLAIEFDTWSGTFNGVPDSSANEISIHTGGTGDNSQSEDFSIGRVSAPANMSNGDVHTVRVRYVPGTLEVYMNDLVNPVLSVPYDFLAGGTHINTSTPVSGLNLLGGTSLFAGFTASTGGSYENHDILSWYAAPYPFEMNDPASELTLDGQADPGPLSPIEKIAFTSAITNLDLNSTNAGNGHELVYAIGATVPLGQGALSTAGGQILNVSLASPFLGFLYGGSTPSFAVPFPASPLQLPLSSGIPVVLSAQMVNVDPSNADGIAISHAIELDIQACSTSENFDALAAGNNLPLGWTSAATPWTVRSGTTTSTGTGPLTGAFSGPNYLYCETSGAGGTSTFVFETCQISVGQLSTFTLEFRLSRLGASIGTLNVLMDDGTGTFSNIATYTGAEPAGLDWTLESIPFLPAGPTVAFRFEYTGGGTFTGDLAIDDFIVR